ncbi:hypothetical protein AOQ84DRAFT_161769 [Glonium stellatum]|uniref:Uncharacterized protein n=1 Tax=Glonium stellatum TaxID=574774 RepID=A0A8E2JMV9_9PEZI|nr:hypothetical protein AOQ84DRAFT_161769 [Glonium stellatum]
MQRYSDAGAAAEGGEKFLLALLPRLLPLLRLLLLLAFAPSDQSFWPVLALPSYQRLLTLHKVHNSERNSWWDGSMAAWRPGSMAGETHMSCWPEQQAHWRMGHQRLSSGISPPWPENAAKSIRERHSRETREMRRVAVSRRLSPLWRWQIQASPSLSGCPAFLCTAVVVVQNGCVHVAVPYVRARAQRLLQRAVLIRLQGSGADSCYWLW